MSMSEPFLPAHEPRPEPDAREHDIDPEEDVFIEPAGAPVPTVEADLVHEDAPRPPFRTPVPGNALTPDQLADELGNPARADADDPQPSAPRPNGAGPSGSHH
jgi:hypothetical protein